MGHGNTTVPAGGEDEEGGAPSWLRFVGGFAKGLNAAQHVGASATPNSAAAIGAGLLKKIHRPGTPPINADDESDSWFGGMGNGTYS